MLFYLHSIILSFCLMTLSAAFSLNCLRLPKPPLHGRLVYKSGRFRARLKCERNTDDISLSERNHGILVCDPKDAKSVENFKLVEKPVCFRRRLPSALKFRALFSFFVKDCDEDLTTQLSKLVGETLWKLNPLRNCSTLFSCFWERDRRMCNKNYNVKDNRYPMQLDVSYNLMTSEFAESLTVNDYLHILNDSFQPVRNAFVDFSRDVPRVKSPAFWSNGKGLDPRSKFYNVFWDISAGWEAICDSKRGEVGTLLGKHLVASCRGCKVNYHLDKSDDSCYMCPLNEFTSGPFATSCVPCHLQTSSWSASPGFHENCLNHV